MAIRGAGGCTIFVLRTMGERLFLSGYSERNFYFFMATSMNYSVVARKNPAKKEEPSKYYAVAQSTGVLDFEEMCEAITGRTTCTETDVRAALAGIIYEANRALKAGRIVRLGDLGSLQMGISSKGAEKAEDFTSSLIRKTHVIFRPGKSLTNMAKTVAYTRVATRSVQGSQVGGGGSGSGGDGNLDENPMG